MYVRKFEADSIEEALQNIKHELGPDAIILKTVTNKGLKGAFKKKKVEVTAAISEKNYTKKAKVDNVLAPNQKQEFYSGSSSYVSNMIDSYEDTSSKSSRVSSGGYGQLGLNKQVNTTKREEAPAAKPQRSSLDDFLAPSEPELAPARQHQFVREEEPKAFERTIETVEAQPTVSSIDHELIEKQRKKIDELERKLYELSKNVEKIEKDEPAGVYHLRATLKSFDISESFIQQIIKKVLFELGTEELENSDLVFEYALRDMMEVVHCEMPLFSSLPEESTPAITVLLSETTCGQSGMLQKIGALKSDSVLIRSCETGQDKRSFTERVFGMDVVTAQSIAEIVGECRKAVEAGKSVFIDYKNISTELDETKKFIDGLKRAFANVEILVSLSAIHSEIYNKKVISRYQSLANGLVVSHLDLCLNYGMLFNIGESHTDLPYKFFGTGNVVPDDLEAATAERVIAGIFRFS